MLLFSWFAPSTCYRLAVNAHSKTEDEALLVEASEVQDSTTHIQAESDAAVSAASKAVDAETRRKGEDEALDGEAFKVGGNMIMGVGIAGKAFEGNGAFTADEAHVVQEALATRRLPSLISAATSDTAVSLTATIAFTLADANGDGHLTPAEVSTALGLLNTGFGLGVSNTAFNLLLKVADCDASGTIDKNEFKILALVLRDISKGKSPPNRCPQGGWEQYYGHGEAGYGAGYPGYGPQLGYGPQPDFGPQPHYGPQPGYGPQPAYGPRPGYGPQPAYGAPRYGDLNGSYGPSQPRGGMAFAR